MKAGMKVLITLAFATWFVGIFLLVGSLALEAVAK